MVTVRTTTSRVCNASKDTLWRILEDVDNWNKWASDEKSSAYMLSHKMVNRENSNVVVCDEDEVVGGYRITHRDRYTFYPKERLIEEIVQGPISGTFDLQLAELDKNRTKLVWDFNVKAETLKFKVIGLFKGKSIVQTVADDYCRQLAEYAEAMEKRVQ